MDWNKAQAIFKKDPWLETELRRRICATSDRRPLLRTWIEDAVIAIAFLPFDRLILDANDASRRQEIDLCNGADNASILLIAEYHIFFHIGGDCFGKRGFSVGRETIRENILNLVAGWEKQGVKVTLDAVVRTTSLHCGDMFNQETRLRIYKFPPNFRLEE